MFPLQFSGWWSGVYSKLSPNPRGNRRREPNNPVLVFRSPPRRRLPSPSSPGPEAGAQWVLKKYLSDEGMNECFGHDSVR